VGDPIQNTDNTASQNSGSAQPAAAQQPDDAATEKNSKGWEAAKAQKDRADALARELDSYKANQAKSDKERLEKQGEYQKLYEQEKSAREASEQKAARAIKRSSLQAELSGMGLSFDPRVLDIAPLGDIELDGERAKNAAEVAKAFAESSPLLFGKTGKSGEPFNTPTPNPGGGRSNFDPRKVRSSDVSSLTPEQRAEVAALAGGGSTKLDMFGRPVR